MGRTHNEKNIAADIVKTAIQRIRTRNPAFSNNALAKAVGVSSGFMSQFLSGKKNLSTATAVTITRFLNLSGKEEKLLMASIQNSKYSKPGIAVSKRLAEAYSTLLNDDAEFLSHWYNVALADLVLCKEFYDSPAWVSKRLGITKIEAEQALKLLVRMKIIEKKQGKWQKNQPKLKIPTHRSKPFIREYHAQTMNRAIQHMSQKTSDHDFSRRSIRGRTIAVNPAKLKQVQEHIENFMNTLTDLLEDNNCEQVYQLNIQFFPLTE